MYPNDVVNFLQLQDGVDKVIAAHPNDRGNHITAIENFVGIALGGQGYTEAVVKTLIKYRGGCAVEYKSASDIYVRAGGIVIPDASGNVRLRMNPSDLTVDFTMIDTGSEAGSTVYYVYAVADAGGTTFTVVISTSATTPTGCTFYRLIGAFFNDGSSNIQEVGNLPEKISIGNRVAKVDSTAYLAITDGEVSAYSSEGPHDITALTDASNPPTTQIDRHKDWGDDASDSAGGVTMSVRKGDYWKVTGSAAVYWISK